MFKAIITLIIVLATVNLSLADDSFSVAVSCIIPAIPGVNAPTLKTERLESEANTDVLEITESQKENRQEVQSLIGQDIQEEQLIGDDPDTAMIVKTFYSR